MYRTLTTLAIEEQVKVMLDMTKVGLKKIRVSLDQIEINSDRNGIPKKACTGVQTFLSPKYDFGCLNCFGQRS